MKRFFHDKNGGKRISEDRNRKVYQFWDMCYFYSKKDFSLCVFYSTGCCYHYYLVCVFGVESHYYALQIKQKIFSCLKSISFTAASNLGISQHLLFTCYY